MSKKVELYEVIAKRLQESEPLAPNAEVSRLYNTGNAYELAAGQRRAPTREIVLSLDAAFVIFVVILILLGTAYSLGITHGEQKQRETFDAPLPPLPKIELETLGVSEAGATTAAVVKISPQQYTLRLIDNPDFAAIQAVRGDLMTDSIIRDGNVEIFIFNNGGRYILTAGAFATADERNLNRMREFFGKIPNYRDMSLERVSDLGAPVL